MNETSNTLRERAQRETADNGGYTQHNSQEERTQRMVGEINLGPTVGHWNRKMQEMFHIQSQTLENSSCNSKTNSQACCNECYTQ